jgi:hypothetical protein
VQAWGGCRRRAEPHDAPAVMPKRHRLPLEVPEDGVEGLQPLVAAKHQLVLVEGDDVQVDDEALVADGDGSRCADAGARDALPVGDADSEPWARCVADAELARRLGGVERVHGPESTRARRVKPPNVVARCMVSAVLMPVRACKEMPRSSSEAESSTGTLSMSSIRQIPFMVQLSM